MLALAIYRPRYLAEQLVYFLCFSYPQQAIDTRVKAMTPIQLDSAFQALVDYRPMNWQRRLFHHLCSGDIPRVCDLPTGLGKTSVIPIWTIALAQQAQAGNVGLPRRLVYVVDRRTVVDQATEIVEKIRQRLLAPGDPRWLEHQAILESLAGALGSLAATQEDGTVLGVSTLRGELADNEEWKSDPARPAIIIGTVDMTGSKLLFNGYGDGRYWKVQHAGLIGQDSLIVLDEAHLTPAFGDLLMVLSKAQHQDAEPRPVQVMELSATSRAVQGSTLSLELEDERDEVVRVRLDAVKRLRLHGFDGVLPTKRADVVKIKLKRVIELAVSHRDEAAKVLIYLRSPQEAQDTLSSLKRELGKGEDERVALLTGTMRGYERDELVRSHPVYRAFLDPGIPVKQTVYLVSTSAGEVGIDIDADHMVCDLTTLDSMVQRLGRVNRRGGPEREARIDVVTTEWVEKPDNPSDLEKAVKATHEILCAWVTKSNDDTLDVSTRASRGLISNLDNESREKSFAPKPVVPPATSILLDAWSFTTVTQQMPGRPEVAQYLHGLADDPPETYIVWRNEVALLHRAEVDQEELGEWFQACRIEGRERLRDRTDRVRRNLGRLLAARRHTDQSRDFPVVLLGHHGMAEWSLLSTIVERDFDLRYLTIVLPAEAGGLSPDGALDPTSCEVVIDVAEEGAAISKGRVRERWLHTEGVDGADYRRLMTRESGYPTTGLRERERVTLQLPTEGADEEGHGRWLVLMTQPTQASLDRAETAKIRQSLGFHEELIVEHMNRITGALGLEGDLKHALTMAAKWHDRGKGRPIWQWYAGNSGLFPPLAKSTKYLHSRALGGYRHEFGSMLEAADDEDIRRHPESDLILHLIAAHHGWSRPYFRTNAWRGIDTHTTSACEEMATEAMRRFGQVQRRYGRWGLAWLESLVRCADIGASQGQEEGI